MASLGCNAASCMYNADSCCCLSSIHVHGKSADSVGDTCCGDYKEKDGSSIKNSMGSDACPKLTLSISCDATNCIYNSMNSCEADHIDISGLCATDSSDTVCTSFKCR